MPTLAEAKFGLVHESVCVVCATSKRLVARRSATPPAPWESHPSVRLHDHQSSSLKKRISEPGSNRLDTTMSRSEGSNARRGDGFFESRDRVGSSPELNQRLRVREKVGNRA